MIRSHKRAEGSERPITFNAAERLNAFDLAHLWADRTAWPIDERTHYDELAELACMAALTAWLGRWIPIAIHGALIAGAKPEAVAGAFGASLDVTFRRWDEWASRMRDAVVNGRRGITEEEYETVAQRFAVAGIVSR